VWDAIPHQHGIFIDPPTQKINIYNAKMNKINKKIKKVKISIDKP